MNQNVHWQLFPVNGNSTAWKPVSAPSILVVPHVRTVTGLDLEGSGVFNAKVYIEDVPLKALVAGPDHIGIKFPTEEIYSKTLSNKELQDRKIDVRGVIYLRAGEEIDRSLAEEGDEFRYTSSSGITSTILYSPTADYYDLSDIALDIELLPPSKYNLVYYVECHKRIFSTQYGQDYFLCIDDDIIPVVLRFPINHPGDIIGEFSRLTPAVYLTNERRSLDSTIQLYRPFTDAIQDLMDEQSLLKTINWINYIPIEAIQYLSPILGWETPFFPQWLDDLRRALLRKISYLQSVKGSEVALKELYRLFDLEVIISKLWWSADGKILIRPGSKLPTGYQSQEIKVSAACQIDLLYDDWAGPGYGIASIPLMHKPVVIGENAGISGVLRPGNVTIEAYLVNITDQSSYNAFKQIASDIRDSISTYGSDEDYFITKSGSIRSRLHNELSGVNFVGYSQLLLSGKFGEAINQYHSGDAILSPENVRFDITKNSISFSINQYLDDANLRLFAFATYEKEHLDVPSRISNLQSNRFDIRIIVPERLQQFHQSVIDFALEFHKKIRSIHSLLRASILLIDLTENYEATDIVLGADAPDRYDVDFGRLQVPPAIIPNIPSELRCKYLTDKALGYKQTDILYRKRKYESLLLEYQAYKDLDDRETIETGVSRLAPGGPNGRSSCKYTDLGQDRVYGDRVETDDVIYSPGPNSSLVISGQATNLSPIKSITDGKYDGVGPESTTNRDVHGYASFRRDRTELRSALCQQDGVTDQVFKGRVDDESMYGLSIPNSERYEDRGGCAISFGSGAYWSYPTKSVRIVAGVAKPCIGSRTNRNWYSGKTTADRITGHFTSQTQPYLEAKYTIPLSRKSESYLGKIYRAYDVPSSTIHFNNRRSILSYDQKQSVALQRPDLNVQKVHSHFPGCRFAFMANVLEDYVSDDWKARPWDPPYSSSCGPKYVCGDAEPSWLNAELMIGTDGDQWLTFDDVPYSIPGNGLNPDIPSFGDHTSTLTTVHKIHTAAAVGHPAISFSSFEHVGHYDASVSDALFNTARPCGTAMTDVIDGYPASQGETGYVPIEARDFFISDVIHPPTARFLFGDGILDGTMGLRFGCGCSDLVDCEPTMPVGSSICGMDLYRDEDGLLDSDGDKVSLSAFATSVDHIGLPFKFDGSIGSFMESQSSDVWPSSGSFIYRDDYNVLYESSWTFDGSLLDITSIIQDPAVHGLGRGGHVHLNKVYRRGVITIHRMRSRVQDDGYEIVSDGNSQYVDEYVDYDPCGIAYEGDFKHRCNYYVTDACESIVTEGSAFVDVDDDNSVIWGEVTLDGSVIAESTTVLEFTGFGRMTLITEAGDDLITEDGELIESE